MKKRKMPAHIVLPNGMWRFVKGKAKTSLSKPRKPKRAKRKRHLGGANMARRSRKRSVRSSPRGMLSKGILPVGGIIGAALIGAGAATLQDKVLPQYHPLQGVAVGFAVGGIGGAVGAYARNMLSGGASTSKTGYTTGY